jgi:hypothetical protein
MPLLRADDDARNLRSPWLGPDASIRWPMDWTMPEWAVATLVATITWIAVGSAGWYLFGAAGTEKLQRLILTLTLTVPAGPAAAWQAKQQVAPLLDGDRNLSWLVAGWCSATRILWRAHGPIDRALWVSTGAAWLTFTPFILRAPGPGVLWLAATGYLCAQIGRRVRDRVESPQRRQTRTWARLDRTASPVWALGVPVLVPVRVDACIPRAPYRPGTRARFLYDLTRKAAR